jgi:hypothetical protein
MPWKVIGGLVAWTFSTAIACHASIPVETSNEIATGASVTEPEAKASDEDLKARLVEVQNALSNPKLRGIIKGHVHPDASIISLEDLNASSRAKFLGLGSKGAPGLAIADFNGDGVTDYAALLRFPQRRGMGLGEWLVVFMGTRDGSFNLRLLEKYDGFHDDVYITIQRPGEVKLSNTSTRIAKLTTPGITRMHPDRRQTLFYWQKSRFQRAVFPEPPSVASRIPSP